MANGISDLINNYNPRAMIIINADDFGLGAGVDEGILQLAERRKISSTTIVACGRHFEEGIAALKKRTPHLGTGVHLCLTYEKPVLPVGKIPSLVDDTGHFFSRNALLKKFFFRELSFSEIEAELKAQVARIRDSSITISHFDGHGHIQVFPWLAETMTTLAKHFNVHAARMPFEPLRTSHGDWLKGSAARVILNAWSRKSKSSGYLAGMRTPDHFFGISTSGRFTVDGFKNFPISPGTITEIMVHPGLPTPDELNRFNYWDDYTWKSEYQALASEEMAQLLDNLPGELVNFMELTK